MPEALLESPERDLDLLRRFVAGDRSAFDRLVDIYHRPIFRFLYRIVGDWLRAEEVAQETFIRAFRGAAGFKGSYQFNTWLYTIAKNCARSDLKRARKSRERASAVPLEDLGSAAGSRDLAGPARSAERRELSALVRRAVQELEGDQRMALILTFYEGLSYEEVAEIMGRPRGTIKSWVFRAKRRLARALSDWNTP